MGLKNPRLTPVALPKMGPTKNTYQEAPSRPSSANSFSSDNYSGNNNQFQRQQDGYGGNQYRQNSSYAGGYDRRGNDGSCRQADGPAPSFDRYSGQNSGRNNFSGNSGQDFMRTNVGQLGLDPSTMAPINKNFYVEHPEVASMTPAEVADFRKEAQMAIAGNGVPKPIPSFKLAGFPEPIERKLVASGFTSPTPIQAQGWSMALSGQNMVGIAQTGSGKTLSFVLPALVHIKGQAPLNRGDGPIALVLAPTRELAVQIQEVARTFGNTVRVNSTCLYGGAPKSTQIRNLRAGCEIVVATPGRLLDLMNENIVTLQRCSFLVLDEADRMLDMGFEPQIRQILSQIRTDRQVLMWSATWPKNVMKLAHDMLGRDFIQVKVGASELNANKNIKQIVVMCNESEKKEKLNKVLQDIWDNIPEPTDGSKKQMVRTIVFCNKKSTVDFIERSLKQDYWPIVSIHGDKAQGERDWAIRQLKCGQAAILVATDVAARGLDVKDVMVVINFDLPMDMENYIHRIGRTARGSSTEGTSYAFFASGDASNAEDLIKIISNAGQTVPAELEGMRRHRGPSKSGYASYGRGGRGGRGGYGNNSYGGGGSGSQPKQHIRFNPY